MVLSDRTIARLLAEGRIEIDPYDDALLQPSSVDVRVDRFFRVFHNNRYPFIDVKAEQDDLTELVEVDDEQRSSSIPGEFVLGSTLERVRLADDLVARLEGKSSGEARAADPLDRRLHRPRLGRPRDARALERRQPADHDLPRHEDRPDLLHADHRARRDAVRRRRVGSKYQGQRGPTASRYWQNFETTVSPGHRRDRVHRSEGRPRAARAGPAGARARPRYRARGSRLAAGRRAGVRAT